jgi:DNA helicase HerA-like ATPase
LQTIQFDPAAADTATREPLGRVMAVDGTQATIRLNIASRADTPENARATVGRFMAIHGGTSMLVGLVTKISTPTLRAGENPDHAIGLLDLLGEIKRDEKRAFFQRGITDYPLIGDRVELLQRDELRLIYDIAADTTINIGSLQQDASIGAYIDVNEMIRKHFAVFGTTGVGKSSGIAILLREILDARPDLHIFLIDPHNEYGNCFDDRAYVLNPRNLKLPFWLFNFEEIVDVYFRGRPGLEEEVAILSELIPLAKTNFTNTGATERLTLRKNDPKSAGFTVDTPVPYRLSDLMAAIDERMGKLENRSSSLKYQRLMSRIETVRKDARYSFMFDNANIGGDTMVEVLSQLFRLPTFGKPMTIMQLAGFPAEVVDSVVSVLCRMAFEFGLWSDGAAPLLFVCEESHRYAPADRTIGFGPTRKAVSRIAKEGRKYGVFLGLITQRPAELDATIISQCSTLFTMRMANDRDQGIVRAAVSDAAGGLLSFVPSLGTREVFAFGEGVALPTRLKFKELAKEFIPRSESLGRSQVDADQALDTDFIAAVVQRWRGAMMQQKGASESESSPLDDLDTVAAGEFVRVPQGRASDPPGLSSDPLSGYGRNAGARLDPYAGVQPVQGHPLRGLRK